MEQRQTGGKADEVFFSFAFFEWDEREQHAEESKKREQRMEGGRRKGREGEPSLSSRLERGQNRACRLW